MSSPGDTDEDIDLLETGQDKSTDNDEGNTEKNTADSDELLLLSTSPKLDSPSKKVTSSSVSNRQKASSAETHEVVELDDDLDLEILEEVSSIPGASFSASGSGSSEDEEESDESLSFGSGKINIFHSHGSFFLWNAEDVQMLREECRIVGKLVGCLPRAPRQNIQLGLPLQLMPEEARLLVDIDAAAVVMEKPASETVTKARKAAFENVRQQNFQIQQRLYKKHRKEEVSQRMDSIIAGKKAKKRKLKEEAKNSDQTSESLSSSKEETQEGAAEKVSKDETGEASAENISKDETDESSAGNVSKDGTEKPSDEPSSENISKDEKSSKTDDDEDIDKLTVDDIVTTETSEAHSLVQIFTESPWKRSLVPFKDWAYPGSARDVLRYLVYKDLWDKGFYLTSGSKFGGDFLVYPGDPARYHSHYIAVCRSQFDEMPCLDLVSMGRLASNVRKTALLCALDRNRKVTYTSLTWTGIS